MDSERQSLHDAQFAASREAHIRELVQLFRISPHMLADPGHATYATIAADTPHLLQWVRNRRRAKRITVGAKEKP